MPGAGYIKARLVLESIGQKNSVTQVAHGELHSKLYAAEPDICKTLKELVLKTSVYVDASNITMNGGHRMRYDVLREFAARDNAEVARLNAYVSYDTKRAESDNHYRTSRGAFLRKIRDFGYKVVRKEIRWYADDEGGLIPKANADLDLAVDVLLQTSHGDRIVLVTGDGDFVKVVQALQARGNTVEVVAFDNVSNDLRREADLFISGFLIPGLLPVDDDRVDSPQWGDIGSRVRGTCYSHIDDKNFGFLRYLRTLNGDLWKTDSRTGGSPYGTIFFHDSKLSQDINPRDIIGKSLIFEFDIVENPHKPGQLEASNIRLVAQYGGSGDY